MVSIAVYVTREIAFRQTWLQLPLLPYHLVPQLSRLKAVVCGTHRVGSHVMLLRLLL